MADNAYLIDGNRLKEKAVPLLWPTEMEPGGHLPDPVQAVVVSEIESMLYREGVELTRCRNCEHWKAEEGQTCGKCENWSVAELPGIIRAVTHMTGPDDFCSDAQRRVTNGIDIRG